MIGNNTIKLKPISELLGMNFFIPSYQRGYRWTEQQVKDLLDDIYAFAIKRNKTDKEFYCLQPIVVKKLTPEITKEKELQSELDKNNWYEVVDGQQRLTTIHILITYLVKELYGEKSLFDKHKKHLFEIEYETRPNSKSFLKNINDSDEYIDYHFIFEAFTTITNWFKQDKITDPQVAQETIRNTLICGIDNKKEEGVVQVIWYEIFEEITDKNKAIDTFIRINMGKIPLTNSELIKALFLQKRNFETNTAELRQIEIANEWDRIEYTLQNDDFWGFINKDENEKPARIEFLFDLMFDIYKQNEIKKVEKDFESQCKEKVKEEKSKKEKELIKKYGNDNYSTFRFFNEKFGDNVDFKKVKVNWNDIKKYFLALEEWFNEPIWYHYIGYLIFCGTSIIDIYNDYNGTLKNDFIKKLKEKVKKTDCYFYLLYCSDQPNFDKVKVEITKTFPDTEIVKVENKDKYLVKHKLEFEDIKTKIKEISSYYIDYKINLPFENKNKPNIRKALLLFNIEYIVKQYKKAMAKSSEIFIRFPFELFKKEKWDIEHIDSFTQNEITDFKTQKEWLENSIEDLQLEGDIKTQYESYINSGKVDNKNFTKIKEEILKLASEEQNDEETKNSFGNLTLLDAGTNRGYGNALFPTKRRKIIEKDTEGKFIPICTKNVFLKYFDKKGTSRTQWTNDDIQNYQNHIAETLLQFLTFKNGGQNNE